MYHGSQQQQGMVFCIPAWNAGGGMSAGFWMPAAQGQQPQWDEGNSLAALKQPSEAVVPDWCNPNAKPFTPASHQDAVNKGDATTKNDSLSTMPVDAASKRFGDVNFAEPTGFTVKRRSRLISQTLGGAAPWQTGEIGGSHAMGLADIEWTSTIRALNLEPKREREVPIKSQLRPSAAVFHPAKQELPVPAQTAKQEMQSQSAKANDAAKENAKPMPVHDWPTLGVESKKAADDTTSAAATPSKATEVHARVAGTAWAKAGGVAKQLKNAEETQKVKLEEAKVKKARDNTLQQQQQRQQQEETATAQRLREERETASEVQRQRQEEEAQRLREEQKVQRKQEDEMRLHGKKDKAELQELCEKELQQSEEKLAHKGRDEDEDGERICSEEDHQQRKEAETKEETAQGHEECEADGWEDDDWNDAPKPAQQQQQQQQPQQRQQEHQQETASQSKIPVKQSAEEGGWDDDDWCVDETAERRPRAQQQGAVEATSNNKEQGVGRKKAAHELERETCAPSSSSDETEVSHSSVTPRGAVKDESYSMDSLLRPAESKEVSNADLNTIRKSLLGFRGTACQTPNEVIQLCAVEDETALRLAISLADSSDVPDRKMFGSRMVTKGEKDGQRGMRGREGGRTPGASSSNSKAGFLPAPSANAYRPKSAAEGAVNREQDFRRSVQSLMNKVCPENMTTIAGRIVELKVASTEELEVVITVIMKKAYSEPHYCETYADLVYNLKAEMPEFPSPDGGKPVSFKSTLLNCCQNEFETIVGSAPEMSPEEMASLDAEEIAFQKQQRKAKTLATMKFIGHLFLRQLLTAKIIGAVLKDLAMCSAGDTLPGEHVVECLCELLISIGYTLETMPSGKDAVVQVCSRLLDLKQRRDKNGKGAYTKRIQFQIQDLLDTRAAGWTKKVFKAAAKTKEEIRNEQDRELKAQSSGKGVDGGSHVIAGARPAYLAAGSTSSLDGGAWQDVSKAGRR